MEFFADSEKAILSNFFTNTDRPVFALKNLPEVVKGALFARYSRSSKSLRRLFLDEFYQGTGTVGSFDTARAEKLYKKVFLGFGDDSVAQLGGAHVACEGVSNIATKIIERSRLMAFLEQSTRFVPFDKPRFVIPWEFAHVPELVNYFYEQAQSSFRVYRFLLEAMQKFYAKIAKARKIDVSKQAIQAKSLDTVRGLLPAATASNLGIYGSGQAYENLLLRLFSSKLSETKELGKAILRELQEVIPDFVSRVERSDRGGTWIRYRENRSLSSLIEVKKIVVPYVSPGTTVRLVDFDPDGELKIIAAIIYANSQLSKEKCLEKAAKLSPEERRKIFMAEVGKRENRRHKPGRSFEQTEYEFDIISDYGIFRDLQRHRMLTIEWQNFTPELSFSVPIDIITAKHDNVFRSVVESAQYLYDKLSLVHKKAASYILPMIYKIRYCIRMNAREAMHMLELRTSPQGHEGYRKICQLMHREIKETAGHRLVAESMNFVNHDNYQFGRDAQKIGREN